MQRVTAANFVLFAEAYGLLAICSLATWLAPFARVGAVASRPVRQRQVGELRDLVRKVRWAILASAKRSPWRTVCFQKGLAAQIMLRGRGVPSTLFFGVAPEKGGGISAHVWVRVGEIDVIGCEEAGRYPALAQFPPVTSE